MVKSTLTLKHFMGLDQNTLTDEKPGLSPDMLNFRINEKYELEKRKGFSPVYTANGAIRAMLSCTIDGKRHFIYISDGILQDINLDTGMTSAFGTINDGKTAMFEFGGAVYILNGDKYYKFDGSTLSEVEGYIPILTVGTLPDGSGTLYEQANKLTPKRRQLFSSDFKTRLFKLAEQDIKSIVYVKVNGSNTNQYLSDLILGEIEFFAPQPAGINNVEICYEANKHTREDICGCCHTMLFGSNTDTRVFLWGNSLMPAYRFHSELAGGVPSAEYFPENNFTVIGNSKITDMIQQYDRQLIFTPDSAFYSYCEIRSDITGNVYSSFPVYSLNAAKGSLLSGCGCVIDGKPVTLCRDGLNIWESTNVENEKNAVCFSAPIGKTVQEINTANDFENLTLFDNQSDSELFFGVSDKIYICNYRLGVWYVYDGIIAKGFCDCFGELLIAAQDNKIYRFDSKILNHEAYWNSTFLTFGNQFYKKDIISASTVFYTEKGSGIEVSWIDEANEPTTAGAYYLDDRDLSVQTICARQFRIPLRRVAGAKLRISSPSGKKLRLLNIAVNSIRKGELTYGI